MRYVYIALIVVLTALVLLFKFQNLESVTVSFLTMSATMPTSILVAVVYVLGMVTGSSLVALVRDLLRRAQRAPGGIARS